MANDAAVGRRSAPPSGRSFPWRGLAWAGLLGLAALAAVPFAAGRVSPAWLRVAGLPAVDWSPDTQLQAPTLPAPFSAEGAQGGLEWRVEGQGIAPRGDDPFDHDLTAPRLVVIDRGAPLVVTARRGRLRLPPRDGPRVVRLDLEGGVRAEGGGLAAATERLTISVDRGASGRDEQPRPAEVRIEAGAAVTVDVAAVTSPGSERAAWRLTAAGLEGTASPLDLALRGPVELAGTAPLGSSSLAGRPVIVRSTRARLVGRGAGSGPTAELLRSTPPGALRLVLDGPSGEVVGGGAFASGQRATVDLVRAPCGARSALGGVSGATPTRDVEAGGTWTVVGARLDGDVAVRWREPGRDLVVEGDLANVSADGALRLEGRPARVADERGWIAAPTLRVARRGAESALDARGGARFGVAATDSALPAMVGEAATLQALLDASAETPGTAPIGSGARALFALRALDAVGDPVRLATTDGARELEARRLTWRGEGRGGVGRLQLQGPLRGRAVEDASAERADAPVGASGKRVRDPGPWRLAASGVDATCELDRLAALSRSAGLEELLAATSSLVVDRIDLERGGAARRQVALAGDLLDWERGRGTVALEGDARGRTGDVTVRAPRANFDPKTRLVAASGGVELAGRLQTGEAADGGAVAARAARATARLATDPAAWSAASDARRSAHRLGGRLILPATLEGLTLEGEDTRRVRVVGARGLSAEADRVVLDGDLVRLESRPGAPPVMVASADGRASARAIDARLSRFGPRARAWVTATGEVVTSGAIELHAAWAVAEVWEPARPHRAADRSRAELGAALGPFAAGGSGGVRLRVTQGPEEPVELLGDSVRGDGAARTLHVESAADRPVVISRGGARFEASAAQVEPLPDERARVALAPPWRAAFGLRSGPATARGAGPLTLDVDLQAARARERGGVLDDVRRFVQAFDASGGVDVEGPKLRATARAARLRDGEVVLTGDPVEVVRGSFRSRTREQVLRLDDE